jgi:hypothetical protein
MPRVTALPPTALPPALGPQIVELTLRIALTGFFNRFNDALQIDDGIAATRLNETTLHPATTETGND